MKDSNYLTSKLREFGFITRTIGGVPYFWNSEEWIDYSDWDTLKLNSITKCK